MSIDTKKLKEEVDKRKIITAKFIKKVLKLLVNKSDNKELDLTITIPKEFDFYICAAESFDLEHNRYTGIVKAILNKYQDVITILEENKNDILNDNISNIDIFINQIVNIMFLEETKTLNSWYYQK